MVNRNVLEARNKYKASPPLTIYPEQKTQKLTQTQAMQDTKELTRTERSANDEITSKNEVSKKNCLDRLNVVVVDSNFFFLYFGLILIFNMFCY